MAHTKETARRGLTIYFALLTLGTAVFEWRILRTGVSIEKLPALVFALMYVPAMASTAGRGLQVSRNFSDRSLHHLADETDDGRRSQAGSVQRIDMGGLARPSDSERAVCGGCTTQSVRDAVCDRRCRRWLSGGIPSAPIWQCLACGNATCRLECDHTRHIRSSYCRGILGCWRVRVAYSQRLGNCRVSGDSRTLQIVSPSIRAAGTAGTRPADCGMDNPELIFFGMP
jgi:hypothetical protein